MTPSSDTPRSTSCGWSAIFEPAAAKPLLDLWQEQWRASAAGSDPATALHLLSPVVALLHAVVYANFLANIEPSEHPYHACDVPDRLAAAVEAATDEPFTVQR